MEKLVSKIRRWAESLKAAREAQRRAEIEARISLREKGGRIYLLCGGTAFACVENGNNAMDIVKAISDARRAAAMYENGEEQGRDYEEE